MSTDFWSEQIVVKTCMTKVCVKWFDSSHNNNNTPECDMFSEKIHLVREYIN